MKNIGLLLMLMALSMAFRPDLFMFFESEIGNIKENEAHAPSPTQALRDVTASIRGIKLNATDATRLKNFYLALADVVERDQGGIIKTSAEVRLINERSGRLCFENTGIAGRYPRLPSEIDAVIGYGIGSRRIDDKWESVEITHDNRKSLVAALRAVAWACMR